MSQAFQAQFQRSGPPSPPSTRNDQAVDGAAALRRFTEGGVPVDAMTGKEMYAIIDVLKAEYGNAGAELESSLLRLKRQLDKKIALLAWVSEHVGHIAPKPSLADRTNAAALAANTLRPATAPSGTDMRQSSLCGHAVTTAAPSLTDDTAILQLLNDFAGGRDHLSMSGVEMFDLIGWLKSHGHSEIEDQLIRVRLQGDKKFQLCSYLRRNWTPPPILADASLGNAHAPVMLEHETEPQYEQQHLAPQHLPQELPLAASFQRAQQEECALAPVNGGSKLHHQVLTMEATLARMEESFAFAVECMQSDMAQARKQLHALKLTVQAPH